MGKIKNILTGWGEFFCVGMTCDKNRKRDVLIVSTAIVALAGILFSGQFSAERKEDGLPGGTASQEAAGQAATDQLEKEIVTELKMAEENTDMSQWPEYTNAWFGFGVKYPAGWKTPLVQNKVFGSNWEQKFQFRKTTLEADNSYIGFDVVVYNVSRVPEIMDTQEFPLLKNGLTETEEEGMCDTIPGHLFETGDYPAEEIYISTNDDCYEPALFFTFTKDDYVYNLVPVKKAGLEVFDDQRMELLAEMPEFFASAATLEMIDIVRIESATKPVVRKKIISAPKPFIFDVDSEGRKVCNRGSKDKPGKSDKGKGKHMDMECCLDPDEYPNPHCYYSQKKYGKYL